jgi:hypothetical protein
MIQNIDKYITPYKLDRSVLTGSGKPGAFDSVTVDSVTVDVPFIFYH